MLELLLFVFILLFLLEYTHSVSLQILNLNALFKHRESVPSFAQSLIDLDTYKKSVANSLDKGYFTLAQLSFKAVILFCVFISGILGTWDDFLRLYIESNYLRGVLFTTGILVASTVLALPSDFFYHFVIEEKHGFNQQTPKLYFSDQIKTILLSLVLLIPVLLALYYFMDTTPVWWWFWAWVAVSGFQLIVLWLYPTCIAPLFNKFTPLEDGEVKDRLFKLAERCSFSVSGIYVIDGSRRSSHSNAYFTGLGKLKRIVFYDTLLEHLNPMELEAVLAHEIGHYKHGHIRKSIFLNFFFSLLVFLGLSLLFKFASLFQLFGISAISHYSFFVIIALFSSPFTHFFTPIGSGRSRKNEYQADSYAVEQVKGAENLQNALLKLSQKNLSNLTPHSAYAKFYYSHPTLGERLSYLEKM